MFPLLRLCRVLLCPVLLLLFSTDTLRAGHIVGGEFTYACRGWQNDDPASGVRVYDVRINVYRDCIGQGAYFDGAPGGQGPNGGFSGAGHITIYRGDALFVPTFQITLGQVTDVPVNLGNPCLVLTEEVCQQIGVYEFTLPLPVSNSTYTLTYQRCCRNAEISNIINPEDIGSTYFIQITPESQQGCNTSPRFNIDPPIAICINEDFQIDLGANEPDGDSLVYKFCSPVVGGGTDGIRGPNRTRTTFDDVIPTIESPFPYTDVTFRTPQFSTVDQLGLGSNLTLDSATGLLQGRPIFRGIFVLGVCVEEWSRDSVPVLLSETKREFQLAVNLCGNQVFADLLETELDDQGRFFIRQCGFGENTIINESTNENFIDEYTWTLEGPEGLLTGSSRDFTTSISQTGIYQGRMILNESSPASNCIDSADFLLGVFPGTEVAFDFEEPGCDDEPISFTDRSSPAGNNQIVAWDWDFADGSSLVNQQNPRHRYRIPGEFPVALTITDNNNCTASSTRPVTYFPSPRTLLVEPDEGFGCVPFVKPFVNLSRPIDDTYTFEWNFGDGNTSAEASPTHTYEQPGVFDVYLGITSPTGCFSDTIFRNLVDVRTAPVADFEWRPEEPTNLFPDFRVFDLSTGGNRLRYVITSREGDLLFTTPSADFDYTLRDSSTVFISQFVTHPSGCIDTLTQALRLKLVNTYFMPDAFTPNGDGLNDQLLPSGILIGATEYRLRVWNRWGELVFSTTDPKEGWDGTFNNADSPGGGYLWDASYIDIGGEFQEFKGGVVLLR